MHQFGHYGVALLSYAPVGYAVATVGTVELAAVGGLVVLVLSTAPDLDRSVPLLNHRGPTHSIAFACLVGAVLAVLATGIPGSVQSGSGSELPAFAFVVGTLATGSHLAADAITPAGIPPFWPVSRRRYSLELVRAGNPVANYVLFVLGLAAVAAVGVVVVPPG